MARLRICLIRFVLIFLGAIIVAACAKSPGPDRVSRHGVAIYDFTDSDEARKQLKQWTLQCESPGSCPSSVGQLIVLVGRSLSVCTATLISSDMAMTSSHCFDLEDIETGQVISSEQACLNAYLLFASNSPGGRQLAPCDEVLKKSAVEEGELKTDYMVIKLREKVNRKFHTVNRDGLPDNSRFQVHKVNPLARGQAELVTESCEVIHRTVLLPQAVTELFPVHVVKGCESIPGNSGSSLLDEMGRVRGVLFAGVSKDKDIGIMSAWSKKVHAKALQLKVGMVTSATCMDFEFPGTLNDKLKGCSEDLQSLQSFRELITPEDFKMESHAVFAKVAAEKKSTFVGYGLVQPQDQLRAYIVPRCFKPEVYSANTLRNTQSWEIPLYYLNVNLNLNDQLQARLEIIVKSYNCFIHGSPQSVKPGTQVEVILEGPDCVDSRGNRGSGKDVWELCS